MVFNPNVTQLLIEKVKQYPILYDTSLPEYKSLRRKKIVWQKIAEELGGEGKLKLFQSKWKTLRATYCRHLRLLKAPDEDGCLRHRPWRWAPYMAFLDEYKNCSENSEQDDEDQTKENDLEVAVEINSTKEDLYQASNVELPLEVNTIEIESKSELKSTRRST